MGNGRYPVAEEEERTFKGRTFASKGERDCYLMLLTLEKAGEIDSIQCQVTTPLTAGITHKTDFKVWDLKRGEPLWIEYKGFEDQRWRDIRKLWKFYGPGRLKVYKGYGHRVTLVEEIVPDNYRQGTERAPEWRLTKEREEEIREWASKCLHDGQKANYFELLDEIDALRAELATQNEWTEIANHNSELHTQVDILEKERDQLKDENENLIHEIEQTQYNWECDDDCPCCQNNSAIRMALGIVLERIHGEQR